MADDGPEPQFYVGETVWKIGSGYSGPGEVAVCFLGDDGCWRYVLKHRIEGGSGTFYHVYGAANLARRTQLKIDQK